MSIRIALFASGAGSNAENIIRYFQSSEEIQISMVLTNNPSAGVIERSERFNIPCLIFKRDEFYSGSRISDLLLSDKIDFVVLAGFLWLIPVELIRLFKGRIINIHPALLPAFGGKGFYGEKVHHAVISSGSSISGITIHHVNEKFDEGKIIFQAACHVNNDDDAPSLAAKIHNLEHKYFPVVLKKVMKAYLENKKK